MDRGALPELDESAQIVSEQDYVAPRDELERQMVTLWEELFGRPRVGIHDNFFELGGDSMVALRFMTRLRGQLGRSVPLAALFEQGTVAELADLIRREEHEARPFSPLVAIRPNGSSPPLFLVHPAGGDVLCYEELGRHLGPDQPLYGLQARGLSGDEELTAGRVGETTVREMAADYLEALREVRPEGPYAVGGWSFGGVIAFEMAQQLANEQQEVHLTLIDTVVPERLPRWSKSALAVNFAALIGVHEVVTASSEDFRALSLEEQLNRILEEAKATGLLPHDAPYQEVERLWRAYTGIVRSVASYEPRTWAGRTLLIRAGDEEAAGGDDLGWGAYMTGDLHVEWIPGTHQTLLEEPAVRTLARELNRWLCRVPEPQRG